MGDSVPAPLGVTQLVLWVVIWIVFGIVYVVRIKPRNQVGSDAPIRTGRMNSNLFLVVVGVHSMGGMSLVAAGIMADSRLLMWLSNIPFDLLFIYIMVMFVWWTRKG